MIKIKILIADDHAILRDGIRAIISTTNNIEIIGEAADGKETIEKVMKLLPDLVIMDIAMPVMDGLEATRRITKKIPDVKILILSQHENKQCTVAAIKAGAKGYLSKRALGSDLLSAIYSVSRGESYLYPSAAKALVEDYREKSNEDSYDKLTLKEREVFKLIVEGHTNKVITDNLCISIKTLLNHKASIMKKLDLHSRTQLIKYAINNGLTTLEY